MNSPTAERSHNKVKWLLGSLLVFVLGLSAIQPASATFYTYANNITTSENTLRVSPIINTVTGGRAELTNLFANQFFVHIQTFTPYPGYDLVGTAVSPATSPANLEHAPYHGYQSQCWWSFADGSYSGTGNLLCRWRDHE
ncbi:MAG: hypothetical protein ACTH0V_11440 [Microbacteriaceae bacterium]